MLDREIQHVKRLVERVPQHHLYFVVPKRVCGLDEERHVSDCVQLVHRDRKRRRRERERDERSAAAGGVGAGEELDLMAFDYDRSSRWVNMLMTNVEHRISMHAYLRSLPHTSAGRPCPHVQAPDAGHDLPEGRRPAH